MYGLHLDFHTCIKMVYLIITQQITDMAINPHEIRFSSHVDWDIQHPSERWCWNLQKSHQSRLCKRKICSWTLACRSASHIWLTPQWIGTWPLHDQEMAGKKNPQMEVMDGSAGTPLSNSSEVWETSAESGIFQQWSPQKKLPAFAWNTEVP